MEEMNKRIDMKFVEFYLQTPRLHYVYNKFLEIAKGPSFLEGSKALYRLSKIVRRAINKIRMVADHYH